jgi:transcriptional regulator with XRE-family HTH domain
MISDKKEQILSSLKDKEYRKELAIEHVNSTLAMQIRNLREKKGWKQSELATRSGKNQGNISHWEDPDYGRYSLTTLKDMAMAFDVALLVKFIPFSELVEDMVNLSETRLLPPSFVDEQTHEHILAYVSATAGIMEGTTKDTDAYEPLHQEPPPDNTSKVKMGELIHA